MALPERLGVPKEHFGEDLGVPLETSLPAPRDLYTSACKRGPADPKGAALLLAASLLSAAQKTSEGRLSAALVLLARLVAKSDANKLLGPDGAAIRHEVMPNGWMPMIDSFPRLRYAWREGLRDLLTVPPEEAGTEQALDEITRLTPAEPEPVAVAIHENWPPPMLGIAVGVLGLGLSLWSMTHTWHETKAVREELARRKRGRIRKKIQAAS